MINRGYGRLFLKKIKVYFLVGLTVMFSCMPEVKQENKATLPKTLNDSLVEDSISHTNKAITLAINPDTSYIETVFSNYQLVNIHTLDSSIRVKLKYADTANFMHKNIYDGLRNAYFNCEMALRVCNAQYFLKTINKNYSLLIYDAARPLHVQQMMWDSIRLDSTTKFKYLAHPDQTSLHNYGSALDVTIIDLQSNQPLDMGTAFDFFGKRSQPAYEWLFLKDSTLSQEAYKNRKLLREVMRKAGLKPIVSEWWHFSTGSREEAAARYELIK